MYITVDTWPKKNSSSNYYLPTIHAFQWNMATIVEW